MIVAEEFNIVDVETTGLDPNNDRVIEIAILRIKNNRIETTFNTTINPGVQISSSITKITGITQEQIEKSPIFEDVKNNIRSLLSGKLFVAHNARFDHAFVKNEFIRMSESIRLKTLCTVRLSRRLFPSLASHSLESIIKEFNIQTKQRHRALADSKAIFDFLQIIQKTHDNEKTNDIIRTLEKKLYIPRYLKNSDVEDLPELPGVYIFWSDKTALYVGKSVNIKQRVKSHFIQDHTSNKDLKISTQVNRIETITTAGELGALLLESKLIKELSPVYNRMLRRNQTPVTILKDASQKFLTIKISRGTVSTSDYDKILKTCRSLKKAKEELYLLAEKYDLCPKLLGLERATGCCFNFQLNKCSGACANKEPAIKYNLRFIEAFAKDQVKKWPFNGTIAILEQNKKEHLQKEAHIINNWQYLGTISDYSEKIDKRVSDKFDHDMYKIIKRHVFDKKRKSKIIDLGKETYELFSLDDSDRL